MSSEATVRCSLRIRKTSSDITLIDYNSQPSAFVTDVDGTKGPTPGAISASIYGTDVDLSQLTVPGLCRIMNQDDTNWVEVGIWDPELLKFYPLMELLPGESYVLRLSRQLGSEFAEGAGTGTGTTGPDTNRLRIRANNAACNVLVDAFEA